MVIANDNSGVESTVNQFVTDYNSLISAINTQEGTTAPATPEPLFGSPTLSLLQQQLLGGLNTQSPDGYFLGFIDRGHHALRIDDLAGRGIGGRGRDWLRPTRRVPAPLHPVGSGTAQTVNVGDSSALPAAINLPTSASRGLTATRQFLAEPELGSGGTLSVVKHCRHQPADHSGSDNVRGQHACRAGQRDQLISERREGCGSDQQRRNRH